VQLMFPRLAKKYNILADPETDYCVHKRLHSKLLWANLTVFTL